MVDFEFTVDKQIITRTDKDRIFSGLIDQVTATFSFSAEWSGVKTAIFVNGSVSDEAVLVDDACDVPATVVASAGTLQVSVRAGNLITANKCEIEIEESGYVEITPLDPVDPTETYIKTYTDATGVEFIKIVDDIVYHYDGTDWLVMYEAEEAARAAAELLRVSAEEGRVSAEEGRVSAEELRVTAELAREQGEADRDDAYVIAEAARDSDYSDAEDARDVLYSSAEDSRDSDYSDAEDARDVLYEAAEDARDTQLDSVESNLNGVATRVSIAEKSIASILASNPSGSPVLTEDTYSTLSLPANAANAWMKAGLSGMTVTNIVDGEDIADGNSVSFDSINGDKYYESYTPSIITGDGTEQTVTNSSGDTVSINVIHLNSIGLESETDTDVLDAMFPHYIDGTVSAGATRWTSKDEDDNIVSVTYSDDNPYRRLPNGTKDTIERKADGTWKRVQRVERYALESADITGYVTTTTNVDLVSVRNFTDFVGGGSGTTATKVCMVTNYSEIARNNRDVAGNDNMFYSYFTAPVTFVVAKGKYADVAAAKAALAGTVIYYELETPIETDLPAVPALNSKPNGTVFAEPCVCSTDVYGTGITESGHTFSEISKVTILDLVNGTEEDVTDDCSLNVGLDGFTCSTAGITADTLMWYELLEDTSTVAIPEKNYEYFDDNNVRIDSVTDKVYYRDWTVANGVITDTLTELT